MAQKKVLRDIASIIFTQMKDVLENSITEELDEVDVT